jgi:outer membrane protein assembly factor BamE (lipoprotein component of BamABCDE complex)
MNYFRTVSILFAVLLLSACNTVQLGRDFDVGVFAAKVEQGVTTQSQVRNWLGEPTSVGISLGVDGARFDEWAYYYGEGELADMSTAKVKILQVKFDAQGKVRGYNWSASKR